MPAINFGDIVTPLANDQYTFTVTGPFRIDAAGCRFTVIEDLGGGFTKRHSEQALSGIDFSGLFPVGTNLAIDVERSDPLPDGVDEYLLIRELG